MKTIDLSSIKYNRLKSISPSSFTSLQACPKRQVLSQNFRPSILRSHPNSYFGSVLHRLLEKKFKGLLFDSNFENEFASEVTIQEEKMKYDGFTKPNMQVLCRDFSYKKLLVKMQLSKKKIKGKLGGKINVESEKEVYNEEKTVFGSIDLVKVTSDFIELIDFKTGQITNDLGEVKEEYQSQIKLYAYLYFLKNRKFPNSLKLDDLLGNSHDVECDINESKELYNQALDLWNDVNERIEVDKLVGKPSIDNCKFCSNRPACKEFINAHEELGVENDLIGYINAIHKLKNGNIVIKMEDGKWIKDLPSDLNMIDNKKYGFFNLTGNSDSSNYRFTNNSQVVEYNEAKDNE